MRSEFDQLLLDHAGKCGANVFQETRVTELQFDGSRPVSASWKAVDGSEGQISFDYLVDASGRNGVMSVKYLKNRCFSQSLKNVAHWGYWEGTSSYMPGTGRENAVWIEALNGDFGHTSKARSISLTLNIQTSPDGFGLFLYITVPPPSESSWIRTLLPRRRSNTVGTMVKDYTAFT